MRTVISVVIIIIAAVVVFFMGTGMNEAMGGAILLLRLQVLLAQYRLLRVRKSDNFRFA